MILYLSSAIDKNTYSDYFKKGFVGSSIQAQRFNSLVIEGIGHQCPVCAVGHPEYTSKAEIRTIIQKDIQNVRYYILGNKKGKFRRFLNLRQLLYISKLVIKKEKVDAIICDAISPLYSLSARILSKKYGLPTIAIVTDVPTIMDDNHRSLLTEFSQYLIQRHNGYVLLTKAMGRLVNPKNNPHIIMEGLCDAKPHKRIKLDREFTTILYTGSLTEQTGILTLINAVKSLGTTNVKLFIYGSGPAEKYVKDEAMLNDNIVFGGLVTNEEAAQLQRNADFLINPRPSNIGYAEFSFPSKVMEYMASGTPLLTTKLAGIPDDYYQYVYTIDDDSVNGIKKAILRVLSIDKKELEEKGASAQHFVMDNKNNIAQGKRIIDLVELLK